jgi:hypothetical protein
MIAQRQKLVTALQNQVNKSGANIVSSEKRAGKLRDDLDDQLFRRKIARDGDELKFKKLTQKADELAWKATKKLSRATTEDERSTASEEFQRAKAFADQALAIADAEGNRHLEKKAMQTLTRMTEDLIKAEKSYGQNVAQNAQLLQARATKEQKNVDKMKKKQKQLLDAFSIVDEKTGELLSPEDRAKQFAKAGTLLREFVDLSGDPLSVSEMLNFTGVAAQLQSSFHEFEIRNLVISQEALRGVSEQIDAAVNAHTETPAFKLAESTLGRDIQPGADEAVALDELTDKFTKLGDAKKAVTHQTLALASAQETLATSLTESGESAASFDKIGRGELSRIIGYLGSRGRGSTATSEAIAELNELFALVEKVEAGGGQGVHPDELTRANAAVQTSLERLNPISSALFSTVSTDAANASKAAQAVVAEHLKLQALVREAGSVASIDKELAPVGEAINALKGPQDSAEAMAVSLGTANTAQQGVSTAAQTAATAHRASATALADAATSAASIGAIQSRAGLGFAHGGKVGHFANGGQGTDTIPAMLSPGETVTNARSSRRFFSQLQAINAGQKPIYRNDGGDTYNTNVGDINVSGAGNPEQTARVVMAKIRREQRRGSAR